MQPRQDRKIPTEKAKYRGTCRLRSCAVRRCFAPSAQTKLHHVSSMSAPPYHRYRCVDETELWSACSTCAVYRSNTTNSTPAARTMQISHSVGADLAFRCTWSLLCDRTGTSPRPGKRLIRRAAIALESEIFQFPSGIPATIVASACVAAFSGR